MSSPFTTVQTELPRDRWGRPLITPPEGGEPVSYQRVTTFVGVLEDTYHLSLWQQRMAVLGTALRRDIQLAAAAIRDPKDRFQKRTLNDLAKQAIEAAQGTAAATTGTALHSLTEDIDHGRPLGYVPEEFEADLEAYRRAVADFRVIDIEGFCVRDDLHVGGSYDRIMALPDAGLLAPEWWQQRHPEADPLIKGSVIWDLKTGGSVEAGLFGIQKITMQMGVYANSVAYDHTLGSRTALPGSPRTDLGIICHLPAGSGQVELIWADIESGWNTAYAIAPAVHAWRKRKDLSSPIRVVTAKPREQSLPERIQTASSYADLQALHAANRLVWTPGLTAMAAARKAELGAAS